MAEQRVGQLAQVRLQRASDDVHVVQVQGEGQIGVSGIQRRLNESGTVQEENKNKTKRQTWWSCGNDRKRVTRRPKVELFWPCYEKRNRLMILTINVGGNNSITFIIIMRSGGSIKYDKQQMIKKHW